MGNCCGSESQEEVQGHQLQPTNKKKPSNNSSGGQTLGGGGSSLPKEAAGEGSREAMLSAAEKRKLEAENRGVKEGGKLSKKLAEQKKQAHLPPQKNEVDDRLIWD